jgi:transcriptional regulator with XRE-family HTH domain
VIGRALKILRQFHGYKQSELAFKLGISKSYLSEIESGKKPVSLELLDYYSQIFDISVSSLVFFSENLEGENRSANKFRMVVTDKLLKVMEWMSNKDEQKPQET